MSGAGKRGASPAEAPIDKLVRQHFSSPEMQALAQRALGAGASDAIGAQQHQALPLTEGESDEDWGDVDVRGAFDRAAVHGVPPASVGVRGDDGDKSDASSPDAFDWGDGDPSDSEAAGNADAAYAPAPGAASTGVNVLSALGALADDSDDDWGDVGFDDAARRSTAAAPVAASLGPLSGLHAAGVEGLVSVAPSGISTSAVVGDVVFNPVTGVWEGNEDADEMREFDAAIGHEGNDLLPRHGNSRASTPQRSVGRDVARTAPQPPSVSQQATRTRYARPGGASKGGTASARGKSNARRPAGAARTSLSPAAAAAASHHGKRSGVGDARRKALRRAEKGHDSLMRPWSARGGSLPVAPIDVREIALERVVSDAKRIRQLETEVARLSSLLRTAR
uniref:Uncharacterized protein n=1 Tax=Bicosoecida sp. CB-2014 TaxID=1486930 RepID=A0A7S1CDY8_9STRA|mmetsp:Transcript_21167/g.74647  ORF Transcript_21167/g.74647 Transcript_21167/m.74647 type:complete len:394 (+) Transcript_21167:144-1325(+)